MKAAHSAIEIAEYLIWRNAQERPEDPDYLTPLKLQKLLYYVQGWHFAETGQPLFKEQIEAWKEGPAVMSVYKAYHQFGKRPITEAPESPPELAESVRCVIESIWNRYKAFSAFELADMTHQEMPWISARKGLDRNARSRKQIPLQDIEREFRGQVEAAKSRLRHRATYLRSAARAHTKRAAPWMYASDED